MMADQKKGRGRLLLDCLAAGWHLFRMPGRSFRGPLPAAHESLLERAGDLQRIVSHLADDIGERNVRFKPNELARTAEFIESQFTSLGYTVGRQEYEVEGVGCVNLDVEIRGATVPDEIVIVGAHYDSVANCPAANDNGSGVAAVLNLARHFRSIPVDRTLRFVAFVNEEEPYAHTMNMGSWVYARRCRERDERITAMLSLETIGYYSDEPESQSYPPPVGFLYPSVGNFIAFVGNSRYGNLVRQVVRTFRQYEQFPSQAGAMPDAMSDIGRSDHWPFWQEGYPALMVTDTASFRYPHYHTPEDTTDKIDFERTARVVRGLERVITELARVETDGA